MASIARKRSFGFKAVALVAGAIVVSWLSGCSLDYGAAMSDALAADVPDMVIYDFRHTVVENGLPLFRLDAAKAEFFGTQQKIRLAEVSFTQYSSNGDGTVVTEGRADSSVFWTETESADLYGAVSFRSARDGVRVESGNLKWDGEARVLTSGTDTVTTLIDDQGSSLSGSGFSADAGKRSFAFGRRVDGAFVSKDIEPSGQGSGESGNAR